MIELSRDDSQKAPPITGNHFGSKFKFILIMTQNEYKFVVVVLNQIETKIPVIRRFRRTEPTNHKYDRQNKRLNK